jgi:hypothetical protein
VEFLRTPPRYPALVSALRASFPRHLREAVDAADAVCEAMQAELRAG